MRKQFLKEVKQFQKIAGILKETWHPDDPSQPGDDGPETDPDDFDDMSEGSEETQGSKITDDEGIAYDMTDGISLPYDGFRTANKFKKVANGLGMKEGPAQYELTGEHAGDYYFVYEDDDEATSPDFIVILNPTMQNNEMIRTLVKKCLNQYGNM